MPCYLITIVSVSIDEFDEFDLCEPANNIWYTWAIISASSAMMLKHSIYILNKLIVNIHYKKSIIILRNFPTF
jgi:hypothetical protein